MSSPLVDLIVLRCADLDQSRQFYHALGLSLALEQHGGGPRHYSCAMGGLVLELYPMGSGVGTAGLRLGIRVADVSAVVGAVRDSGLGEVVRYTGAAPVHALLRDPDGHTIQLEQHGT